MFRFIWNRSPFRYLPRTRYIFSSCPLKCAVSPPRPWRRIRLSEDIKPSDYQLWLYPNLASGNFSGRVTIIIDVSSVQSYIAVHIKGLTISASKLTRNDEQRTEIPLKDCFEYVENEFWICELGEPLIPDTYRLVFEFSGKLTNKIVGFYRSTYKDVDGRERHIATTKFEPTYARQAFPCFDEPAFKATFLIELVKPAGKEFIALSNMPQDNEIANQPAAGLSTVQFKRSFPMSTYLACFIVCDFDNLEAVQTEFGFPITVYARKEFISDLKFARDFAVHAATYYCNYFDITYPLPKLDLIAIPDFVSGAMENWGLITFRETRLVSSEEHSAISTKLDVALTVAHEISHMWFGDLVTMKWWNDLWLNEGFATFMEYKAVDAKYPSWEVNLWLDWVYLQVDTPHTGFEPPYTGPYKVLTRDEKTVTIQLYKLTRKDYVFMEHELFGVMRMDATLSSHPIISQVDNPDQITEIFDTISYSKGASIIRMLEKTVGRDEFKAGIKEYLQRYRFSNAETNDLWFHLRNNANQMDIQSFMDTWTRQMGYPVLQVKIDKEKNQMNITQERFLSDPKAVYDRNSSPYNYRWEVPIAFITSKETSLIETHWFRRTQDVVTVDLQEGVTWVKLNNQNMGYYLVNYEDSMWKELHGVLTSNHKILHASDRGSLIFNAFRLAEANRLSYDVALLTIDYLNRETHYFPWSIAARDLSDFNKKFYGSSAHASFKKYVRFLIKDSRAMTWNVDDRASYANKSLQGTILNLGCMAENKTCLRQAVTLFKQWLTEPAMKLHPELAYMIMFFGIGQTSEEEWNKLWEIFLKESDPQNKVKIMKALCATKEPSVISRLLEYGKNESLIRSQDYLSVIIFCSYNPTANPIVWDFVRKEWPYLVQRYTLNDRYLGKLIPQVTLLFSTETRLNQMKEFFAQYPEAGAGINARKQALERVKNNILWRQTHFEKVGEWFRKAAENIEEEE